MNINLTDAEWKLTQFLIDIGNALRDGEINRETYLQLSDQANKLLQQLESVR